MTTQLIEPATVHLPPLPQLNAGERAALETYCAELLRALSREHVKSVILYGSKARGDAHPDSDIDLLVILDPGDEAQKAVERGIESEVGVSTLLPLVSLVYPAHKASEMEQMGHPLMRNIACEGIVLVGDGITVSPTDTQRFVNEYRESARERLQSAQVLLAAGSYRDSVSRSYYAALDAADAALIAVGTMPRSHEGTRVFFSDKFVKTKLVTERYKDIFQDLQYERTSADYNRLARVTQSEAADALARAKEFVATIERLLPSLLPPNSTTP